MAQDNALRPAQGNASASKIANPQSQIQLRLLPWLPPLAFLGLFFFYPLARILVTTFDPAVLTPDNFHITFSALRFTFYQATLSTLLTLLLGLPSAWLFARFLLEPDNQAGWVNTAGFFPLQASTLSRLA